MATEELDPADNLHERLRQLRTGAICILARGSGSRGGIAIAVRPGSPRMRRWPASARAAAPVADEGVFLAAVLAARVAPALAGRQPHLPGALAFATGVAAARRDPGLAGVPTLAAVRDALRAGAAAGDQRARNEPPGATPDRYDDGAATRRDDRP